MSDIGSLFGFSVASILIFIAYLSWMKSAFTPVSWCLNTNVYEVNLRQYTSEGNLAAFRLHLPRLADMGVGVLWFMPLTPISDKNRKGSMGSYYACSSYTEVNPGYGTMEEFRELVQEAQGLGMKVIIDWVANHTGCDHHWTKEHPEFYKKDQNGEFFDAHGWDDVVDLDYENPYLRQAMIQSMRHWLVESGIDGFRCDMAMLTPVDFWMEARKALDQYRKLFWLAELDPLDNPDYMQVFDAAYTWRWMNAAKAFRNEGSRQIHHLRYVLGQYSDLLPSTACPAWFTSNHDENSWNGTEYEKYGEMAIPLAVFSATYKGISLIYSGQEIPNKRRLQFFDRDPIDWTKSPALHAFYRSILHLRKNHAAFTTAADAANLVHLQNSVDHHVLSFKRQHDDSTAIVIINFSEYPLHNIEVGLDCATGTFVEHFTSLAHECNGQSHYFHLQPWSYQIWLQ